MGLAERTAPTAEEYAAYRERFSNWGRWGADDELGTLNLITDDVRREVDELVRLFGGYQGGYIADTSHSVMPETPLANIIALLEALLAYQ